MEDQIGTQPCIGVIRMNPNKQKTKIKSSGGTWIGFTFQLLLLHPQTHPGKAKATLFKKIKSKKYNEKEPRLT